MNSKTLALAVVAVFVACALVVPVTADNDADAASGFDITDGVKRTVHFDAPVDHVITIGKGTTATVIELGYLDKIVVVDKYSNDKTEPVFDELGKKIEAGEVKAGGTVYSSGIEQLKKDILDSSDPAQGGVFDRTKDAIILTSSQSSADPLYDFLKDKGFANVLVWYDIPEYSLICDFVDKVSFVLSGKSSDLAKQMAYVPEVIKDKLAAENIPAKKAFFVTFSGGAFKVGNTGSIATSLIVAAGGDAYTVDDKQAKPTYQATLPEIYEKGDNPIVFVDESSIWSKADKMEQLKTQLPGATMYKVEPLWNNFCPDSMDGVWAMACAMYPTVFEGDVPVEPEPEESNAMIYAAAGILLVLAIAFIAYFVMKKKKI